MVDKLRLQALMLETFISALNYVKEGKINIDNLIESMSKTKSKLIELANAIENEEKKNGENCTQ